MRTVLALALVLFSATAFAQRALPTEADLKATYCLKVKQHQLVFMEGLLASEPATSPGHARLRDAAGEYRADVQRLKGYVAPRLASLDLEVLQSAVRQAEADLGDLRGSPDRCNRCNVHMEGGQPTPQWKSCLDACLVESPAYVRVNSCKNVVIPAAAGAAH